MNSKGCGRSYDIFKDNTHIFSRKDREELWKSVTIVIAGIRNSVLKNANVCEPHPD
jgi:hypothetical protein